MLQKLWSAAVSELATELAAEESAVQGVDQVQDGGGSVGNSGVGGSSRFLPLGPRCGVFAVDARTVDGRLNALRAFLVKPFTN